MRRGILGIILILSVGFPVAGDCGQSRLEKKCREILREARESKNPRLRLALAKILSGLKDESAVAMLEELLADDCWLVRGQACLSLGETGSPQACPLLRALLEDPYWYVRVRAAIGLAESGDFSSFPILVDALDDIHDRVGILAIESMAGISKERPEVIPLLRQVLRKEHHWMRGTTCYLLAGTTGAAAVADLRERKEKDPEIYVRICAAGALAALGDYSGEEFVVQYLDHRRPVYRKGAIRALTGFPDWSRYRDRLKEIALNDESPEVRVAAVEALEKQETDEITPLLKNHLRRDRSPAVRLKAALTLSGQSEEDVDAFLEKMLDRENQKQVKLAIAAALLNRRKNKTGPGDDLSVLCRKVFAGRAVRSSDGRIVLSYDFAEAAQYGDFLENDGEGRIEDGVLVTRAGEWLYPSDMITNSLFHRAVFTGDIRMKFFVRPVGEEKVVVSLFLNPLPGQPQGRGWWWYDGYFFQMDGGGAEIRWRGEKLKELGGPIQDKATYAWRNEGELKGSGYRYPGIPVGLTEKGGEISFEVKGRRLQVLFSGEILFDVVHEEPLAEKPCVIGFGCYGPGAVSVDNLEITGNLDRDWLSRQRPFCEPHKLPFTAEQIKIWEDEKRERIAGLQLRKSLGKFKTEVKKEDMNQINPVWKSLRGKFRSVLKIFARSDTLHSMGEIRRDLGQRSPVKKIEQLVEAGETARLQETVSELETHLSYLEEKYQVTF